MMPKPIVISAVIVALAALTGCEAAKSVAGLKKQAPDEFEVVSRAPLSIPPDFGLRSPAPGAERPQELNPREQAKTILLRNSSRPEQTGMQEAVSSGRFTRGEAAILAKAGAVNVDPSIRQKVNQESTALAEESESFTRRLLFWQEKPQPGTIVDAEKESRRIRSARAMGDPVSKGNVPVIQRKEKGWLEGIF